MEKFQRPKVEKISEKDIAVTSEREFYDGADDHMDRVYGNSIIRMQDQKLFFESMLKAENPPLDIEKINEMLYITKKRFEGSIVKTRRILEDKVFVNNPNDRQYRQQVAFIKSINEFDDNFTIEMKKLFPIEFSSFSDKETELIRSIYGKDGISTKGVCKILSGSFDKIDNTLLIKILRQRADIFQLREQRLIEQKSYLEKAFLNKIVTFVEKNNLDIDLELIEEKIQNTGIGCIDPFIQSVENVDGRYNSNTHQIFIGFDNSDEEIEYTYNHEALHATSGKIIIKKTEIIKSDEDDTGFSRDELSYIKVGTRFGKSFRWLNEAITEDINTTINFHDEGVYLNEIELFKILCDSGEINIDKKAFYKAYFEDYNEGDKETKYWNILFSRLQDKYDKTFMQRLDKKIKLEGIAKVLEVIKSEGTAVI